MNTTKRTQVMALALTLGITLLGVIGCSKPADEAKPAEEPKKAEGATQAVKYTCPMHPEVVQDKPGKCPKCAMDLVVKK